MSVVLPSCQPSRCPECGGRADSFYVVKNGRDEQGRKMGFRLVGVECRRCLLFALHRPDDPPEWADPDEMAKDLHDGPWPRHRFRVLWLDYGEFETKCVDKIDPVEGVPMVVARDVEAGEVVTMDDLAAGPRPSIAYVVQGHWEGHVFGVFSTLWLAEQWRDEHATPDLKIKQVPFDPAGYLDID